MDTVKGVGVEQQVDGAVVESVVVEAEERAGEEEEKKPEPVKEKDVLLVSPPLHVLCIHEYYVHVYER